MSESSPEEPREALRITPTEAGVINQHYTVRLITGYHGYNTDIHGLQATNAEYRATAEAIGDFGPGAAVLTEGVGYDTQPPEPLTTPGAYRRLAQLSLDRQLCGGVASCVTGLYRDEFYKYTERQRIERKVDVWEYARQRLALQGAWVLYADYTVAQREAFKERHGRDLFTMMAFPNEETQPLVAAAHREREHIACQALIDFALENVDETTELVADGKRDLGIIYGEEHSASMLALLIEAGIQVQHVQLPMETDLRARVAENQRHQRMVDGIRTLGQQLTYVALAVGYWQAAKQLNPGAFSTDEAS